MQDVGRREVAEYLRRVDDDRGAVGDVHLLFPADALVLPGLVRGAQERLDGAGPRPADPRDEGAVDLVAHVEVGVAELAYVRRAVRTFASSSMIAS